MCMEMFVFLCDCFLICDVIDCSPCLQEVRGTALVDVKPDGLKARSESPTKKNVK